MRRMPIMINRPVREKLTCYRPGASQRLEDGELLELAGIELPDVLSSRKIGSGRVVGGPAART